MSANPSDTLDRAGVVPLQDDYCVVHAHEPSKAKGLYRGSAVCDVHEAHKRKSRPRARMDPEVGTLGVPHELRRGTPLLGAQGHGIREALRVGSQVASPPRPHGLPRWGGVLGDHIEEFREVSDQDVHRQAINSGKVRLHVHSADDALKGHSPHTSYKARSPRPRSYMVVATESHWLHLGDVGGDGDAPEVRLRDTMARVLEEQGDPTTPTAPGILVRLRELMVPGDIHANVRLR